MPVRNESEVSNVGSNLRRPERWRGRVRGPFAEWSVFVGAAIAIVVGVLFWTSVWLVVRAPSSKVASSDLIEEAAPSAHELDGIGTPTEDQIDDVAEDDPDTLAEVAVSEWDTPSGRAAAIDALGEDPAYGRSDESAVAYAPNGPVYGPDEPIYGPVEPVYGPFEVAGPAEQPDTPVVAAATPVDAATDRGARRTDELAARADEISARAGEITVRAEELVVKAEEFALRIEGLTTRIEELEAKLEASSTALRPDAVPSPAPVTASQQPARPGETVVVRNAQALGTGRAPWVVSPLPEPGSRVAAGALAVEARARGEAPITQIRLVLDGAPLQVALERRDEKTWRGRASARVAPGTHTVAVTVVDSEGRTGSYRWQFTATGQ